MSGAGTETLDVEHSRIPGFARKALYLTLLTPLIIVPGFFFPYVTTRNIFFRLAIEVSLGIVVWLGIGRMPSLRRQTDPVLRWFAVFLVAESVAAVFGASLWHSLFGDFERMGGVLAWAHLLAFYILLRTLMDRGGWMIFFRTSVIVGVIVVAIGSGLFAPYLKSLPFIVGLTGGSTIGNRGLLAPYLLFAAAFALHLFFLESHRGWRVFYLTALAILLVGILGSGNRSTALGIMIGGVVVVATLLWISDRRALALIFVGLILVIGIAAAAEGSHLANSYRGSNLVAMKWAETFAPQPEAPRTRQWRAALRGFARRPIFGFGPENHEIISSEFFDPAPDEGYNGGLFDRPHNAFLEILSTDGIVGMVAMLGIWLAALATIRRGIKSAAIRKADGAVWIGLLIAYAFYLSFWFFDINSAMLWAAALAAISSGVYGKLEYRSVPAAAYRGRRPLLISAEAILVLAVVLQGIVPLKAAWNMDTAIGRAGNVETRLAAFFRVMNSASPQSFHTMPLYISFLTQLTPAILASRTDPFRAAEFDYALKRGFIEAKQNIKRDPENPRAYVEQAQLSTIAMAFYGQQAYGRGAEKTLKYAIKLSPRHVEYRVLFSRVALTMGDTVAARAQLDTVLGRAPNYGPAYYHLGRITLGRGDAETTRGLLEKSIVRGYPGAPGLYIRTALVLDGQKKFAESASLEQSYIEKKFGKLNELVAGSPSWTVDDRYILARLPIAFLLAGDLRSALRAARAAGVIIKEAAASANTFAADVQAGRTGQWSNRETLLTALTAPRPGF